jgi:hypothetical protein
VEFKWDSLYIMAIVWNQTADFEEGDLSDFDTTFGSGIDAHRDAALAGSFGFRVNITDLTNKFGELSGLTAETIVAVRFLLDPNSLTMAEGDNFDIVNDGSGNFIIQMQWNAASGYQLRVLGLTDTGIAIGSFIPISDASHVVQLSWKASSGPGNDDGFFHLYIDGVLEDSLVDVDNDTKSLDQMRFGVITGVDAGTSGIFYFDNCQWSDDLVVPFGSPLAMDLVTFPIVLAGAKVSRRANALTGMPFSSGVKSQIDQSQVFLSDVKLQIELGGEGMWVDIYNDSEQMVGISEKHGIFGDKLSDRVGGIGTLEFGMINSENNSSGLLGRYSLDHENKRPGWATGIGVRWVVTYSGVVYPLWSGTISTITPDGGQFGKRKVEVMGEDFMRRFDEFDEMNLVPLQQNKTVDQIIEAVLDKMNNRPLFKSLDVGQDTLPVALDKTVNARPTAKIEFNRLMQSVWGYLFVRGNGELVFRDRNARLLDRDVKAQIIEKKGIEVTRKRRDIAYRFIVTYFPIDDSGGNEIVFTSHSTPFEVPANSTVKITIDYVDPNNGARIGIKDIVTLTADTDFKFGAVGDGADNSKNGDMDLTDSEFGGTSGNIFFTNTSGTSGFVNFFQLRAVVLRTNDRERFEADPLDGASPTNITISQRLVYQSDPLKVRDFGIAARDRYGVPRSRIRKIAFIGNQNDEMMIAALNTKVGQRIEVVEKVTGIVNQYFIQQIARDLKNGVLLSCEWLVMEAFDDEFLVWDVGKWDEDKWGF